MSGTTLYDQFETSEKAELEDGIMVEIPGSGAQFWCKRAGGSNVEFTKYVERENRKYRAAGKQLDVASGEEILRNGLAHHVIFDWNNVTDRNGKAMKFSPENAIKLFTDLPDLVMIIYNQASNPDFFLASEQTMEDDAKN